MAEAKLGVNVQVEVEPGPKTVAWLLSLGWTPPDVDSEVTARVFAGLHKSAEEDVSRVIALYERWVAEGFPPLGTSVSRWWDRKLVELRKAISTMDNTETEGEHNG